MYMSLLSLFAIVLFHLDNVCRQGLSIPSFAEKGSCMSTHVCGEEVNPEIMERGMTSKLLYYAKMWATSMLSEKTQTML